MSLPRGRRIHVLLMCNDSELLNHWMALCARHHCSIVHATSRADGLLQNLSQVEFDIALVSLPPTQMKPAVDYLKEISPQSHVLSWERSALEVQEASMDHSELLIGRSLRAQMEQDFESALRKFTHSSDIAQPLAG